MIKAELQQSLPAEDHHYYLELASVFDNAVHGSAETGERTIGDLYGISDLVVDLSRTFALGFHVLLSEDSPGLFITDCDGDFLPGLVLFC